MVSMKQPCFVLSSINIRVRVNIWNSVGPNTCIMDLQVCMEVIFTSVYIAIEALASKSECQLMMVHHAYASHLENKQKWMHASGCMADQYTLRKLSAAASCLHAWWISYLDCTPVNHYAWVFKGPQWHQSNPWHANITWLLWIIIWKIHDCITRTRNFKQHLYTEFFIQNAKTCRQPGLLFIIIFFLQQQSG